MSRYSFGDVMRSGRWSHPLLQPFFAPVSYAVVYVLANHTSLTANNVSVLAGLVGLAAAGAAAAGKVIAAGVLFYAFFTLDCVDGPLARLRNTKSAFGAMLDLRIDRLVTGAFALGLIVSFTRDHAVLEARLAALFVLMFFYYDIFGMYRPDRSERPPSMPESASGPAARERPGVLRRVWTVQELVAPTQSLCSVVFFCGGSLAGAYRAPVYIAACAGLAWAFLARGSVRGWLSRMVRRGVPPGVSA